MPNGWDEFAGWGGLETKWEFPPIEVLKAPVKEALPVPKETKPSVGEVIMLNQWKAMYPGAKPPIIPAQYTQPLTQAGWQWYYEHPEATIEQIKSFEVQFVPGLGYPKGSVMYEQGWRTAEEYRSAGGGRTGGLTYGPHQGKLVPAGGVVLTDELGRLIGTAFARDAELARGYIFRGQFVMPKGGIDSLHPKLKEIFTEAAEKGETLKEWRRFPATGAPVTEIPGAYAMDILMAMPQAVVGGRTIFDVSKIATDPTLASQFQQYYPEGARLLAAYREAIAARPIKEVTPTPAALPPGLAPGPSWADVVDAYMSSASVAQRIAFGEILPGQVETLRQQMLDRPGDYEWLVAREPESLPIWQEFRQGRARQLEYGAYKPTPPPLPYEPETGLPSPTSVIKSLTSIEGGKSALRAYPTKEVPEIVKQQAESKAMREVGDWLDVNAYGSVITDETGKVLSEQDINRLFLTDPNTKLIKAWFLGGDAPVWTLPGGIADLMEEGLSLTSQQAALLTQLRTWAIPMTTTPGTTTRPQWQGGGEVISEFALAREKGERIPPERGKVEEKPPVKEKVDVAKLQTALSPFGVSVLPDYPYISPLPREMMFRIPPDTMTMISDYLEEKGMSFQDFLNLSGAFYQAGAPAERWAFPGRR